MLVLQTLRNRAGLLISVFIGFALLAFILTDLLNSGQSFLRGQDKNIAVIDGQEVDAQVYFDIVNQLEENYQSQSGKPVDAQTRPNILRQAWDEMLNQVIFDKQFEKIGLGVRVPEQGNIYGITAEELKDIVIGKNIDQQVQQIFRNPETGMFDKNLAINFLQNMDQDPERKAIWVSIEKGLMQNRLRTKYNTLLTKGMYVTKLASEIQVKEKNSSFDIQYVALNYATIADSTIKVTDAQLQAYYDEHESDYDGDASREIEYVTFDIQPSQEDFMATEKWITKLIPEFQTTDNDILFVNSNSDVSANTKYFKKGELQPNLDTFAFSGKVGDMVGPYFDGTAFNVSKISKIADLPDSVKARHILVRSKDAVKITDSLKALIEGGADFAIVAMQNSEDKGTAVKGGDLGWVQDAGAPLTDSCIFGKVGKVYTVYSQSGVHLVQVVERGATTKKVQLATIISNVVPSSTTRNNIYSQAGTFASKIKDKETFEAEVIASKLMKKVASNIKESDHAIANIESPRAVVKWAFENEENTTSEVFECGKTFVIACLTKVTEKGVAPFENVKTEIQMKVVAQEKAKLFIERINARGVATDVAALGAKLNYTPSTANAVNFTQFSIPGIGVEPKVVGIMSTMAAGKTSAPIEGENAVYVISVIQANTAETTNVENEKQFIARNLQSQIGYSSARVLKDLVDIEDNRIRFE